MKLTEEQKAERKQNWRDCAQRVIDLIESGDIHEAFVKANFLSASLHMASLDANPIVSVVSVEEIKEN